MPYWILLVRVRVPLVLSHQPSKDRGALLGLADLAMGSIRTTDVVLFQTSPCTAEGRLKEASHTPGTLPPEGAPATHSAGFPPAPPRSTERAREPFYPNEGGVATETA